MIRPLDFWIFGGGRGLSQPFFDGSFYWLVDTYQKERSGRNGTFYKWIGGLGAQIESFQWTHPKPGERRKLCGREVKPFISSREWVRVRVSWAMSLPNDIDSANAAIRDLKRDLINGC